MWKLNEVYAQNICAFKELSYTLQQGVTTLIFGENKDNESQKSNGSGKSALIETIALGVSGSTLRKIKNEEIINDSSDECYVMLQFINDSSDEVFAVERKLFRKGASIVLCAIERGGKLVETDEAVQPSVDAYNKYILEKLGISKDELFNNFILSKHKYQNFLSSSDKEKKEIINRFSNGILVDQAIEVLQNDQIPVKSALKETDLEVANITGRIEMLTEQIEQEENPNSDKAISKSERIERLKESVLEKKASVRQKKEELNTLESAKEELKHVDKQIQELENSDLSLEECLTSITPLLDTFGSFKLTNWNELIELKKLQITKADEEFKSKCSTHAEIQFEVVSVSNRYAAMEKQYKEFCMEHEVQNSEHEATLIELKSGYEQANRLLSELKQSRRSVSSAIDLLQNKLAGVIKCPKCEHKFLLAELNFDSNEGEKALEKKNSELENISREISNAEKKTEVIEASQQAIRKQKQDFSAKNSEWTEKLGKLNNDFQNLNFRQQKIEREQKHLTDTIGQTQSEINDARRKLFDEVFSILDDIQRKQERQEKSIHEDIQSINSSIETLENSIEELSNASNSDLLVKLKSSLKEFRDKSAIALDKKTRIEKELVKLEEQEQNFVMFKTYLANTKVEALSRITNDFLENIGSDIRIKFSGYTVLKTGKVREKISVSLIRSGLDCGSFGKFSEGEAARVNLATILAMQKLINSDCEAEKGLDLLVMDEILEAVDEDGLAHMFSALNRIGVTALIVSHGNIAESYPHKIKIIKENGQSKIE